MSEGTNGIRAAARAALVSGVPADEVACSLLAGAMWVGLSQRVPDEDARARIVDRAVDRVCEALNATLNAAAEEVER